MARLTKRDVDAFVFSGTGNSSLLWDGEFKGFGVRAFPSGTKKFIVQYRTRGAQQRRMTIGPYGALTVERARELAKAHLGKVAEGADPAGERKSYRAALTVAELCDLYMEAADAGLIVGRKGSSKKASTIYIDRGRIDRHIKPLLGRSKVADVRQPDIEALKNSIALGKTAADVRTGRRGRAIVKGGRGTATRALGLLGAIFQWGVANGHAPANPVRGVRRFADRQCKALLSRDQYRALGDALRALAAKKAGSGQPAHHLYGLACIRFIALTGLRRGEALNLRWSEIDLDHATVRLGDTKTGESVRPLARPAIDLLRALEPISDHIFASYPDGPPYGALPRLWLTAVREAARLAPERADGHADAADLAGITLHSLRHSFAGVAEELGASLPTIAALLGHRLAGVTAGYVLKRVDRPLVAFADRVGTHIADAMGDGAAKGQLIRLSAAR